MAYDVSEHPLLSASATALDEGLLTEHQEWAETQLGVSDTSYTGKNKRLIERAIALQINWQLALPENIWFTKQASSAQSKQNVTYRDGILLVDPRAAALVALVEKDAKVESRYGDIRSIR